MAPAEVLERIDSLKRASNPIGHITVTDLARSKEWRKELPKVGVMEITDRGETAGWLVSEKDIEAIVYAVIELEKELEDASLSAMFQERPHADLSSWKSGDQLKAGALEYLSERGGEIEEILDEYR